MANIWDDATGVTFNQVQAGRIKKPGAPVAPAASGNVAVNPNPAQAPATIAEIPRPAQANVMRSAAPVAPQQSVSAPVQPPAQPQVSPVKQTAPVDMSSGPTVSDGAGGVYTPERGAGPGILSGIQNFFKDSAQAAKGEKSYDQIRAERAAGESANVAQGVSNVAAAIPQQASSPGADILAKHQAILNGQQSAADQGSLDALKTSAPNPMQQDMPLTTKDVVPGGYLERGDGIIASRNKDGKLFVSNSGATGAGIAGTSQGNPNLGTAEDNLRQISNIKALQDSTPQGGIGILGDGGIEAANAEKTARWRQDDLVYQARQGNQAAIASIINANSAAATEASRANTEAGKTAVAARGQDVQAKSEAARIAGNPQEQQLKQAQAQGIMAQTDSAQMLADMQKKAIAGDAQAMASYQAITGKKATPATDRYMTVTGGEEVGPDGMTKVKKPSGVFDAQTGQFVQMGGGQQAGQAQAPASALDYLKKNPGQSAAFKAKYGYLPEGF